MSFGRRDYSIPRLPLLLGMTTSRRLILLVAVIDTTFILQSGMTTRTNAMSISGNGSGATTYAIAATHLLFSMFESIVSIMIVNLLVTRSHMHHSDVTKMFLNF